MDLAPKNVLSLACICLIGDITSYMYCQIQNMGSLLKDVSLFIYGSTTFESLINVMAILVQAA